MGFINLYILLFFILFHQALYTVSTFLFTNAFDLVLNDHCSPGSSVTSEYVN